MDCRGRSTHWTQVAQHTGHRSLNTLDTGRSTHWTQDTGRSTHWTQVAQHTGHRSLNTLDTGRSTDRTQGTQVAQQTGHRSLNRLDTGRSTHWTQVTQQTGHSIGHGRQSKTRSTNNRYFRRKLWQPWSVDWCYTPTSKQPLRP